MTYLCTDNLSFNSPIGNVATRSRCLSENQSMKGKKTGGRTKGTPNKNNPFRAPLNDICMDYLTKKEQEIVLPDGTKETVFASQMELDIIAVADPASRLGLMARIFKFVMPELKSVDMDMTVTDDSKTIIDRLSGLMEDGDEDEKED